jgi:hypothetical protein
LHQIKEPVKKTVPEQLAELVKINQERADNKLPTAQSVSLYEYLALQARSPEHIMAALPSDVKIYDFMNSIDSSYTTRFINLPLEKGRVFEVHHSSQMQHLFFGAGEMAERSPWSGFRLAVRVKV